MTPLMDTILEHVPAPSVQTEGPFQMQVSTLDYSSYVGAIGIGRIERGSVRQIFQSPEHPYTQGLMASIPSLQTAPDERLSTIERADRIVVLDAGRIAEVGDHASLLERGGLYAQLIGAQTAQAS